MRIQRTYDLELIEHLHRRIFPGVSLYGYRDTSVWWDVRNVAGEPLGFCGVYPPPVDGDGGYLVRAGLLPGARGRGLQKRMISVRLAWMRRHNLRLAVTYTMCDNNASINSLIHCRFKVYDPQHPWAGTDVLYWWRRV